MFKFCNANDQDSGSPSPKQMMERQDDAEEGSSIRRVVVGYLSCGREINVLRSLIHERGNGTAKLLPM